MVDDKLKNFIPISRKIFNHELWEEKREFSKFEAWVDLLQTARFDKEIRSEWINNKEIKFGRGQLIGSVRFLQKRWNWGSITKVERYLKMLENKDMVVLEKGQGINVITICKYNDYNKDIKDERTQKGQGVGQQKDETNTVNNDNISINKLIDREKAFKESLFPFTKHKNNPNGLYEASMVKAFFDYWREPNKSKTKMKFELQKTWDTSLRLATWNKNDFSNKNKQVQTELVYEEKNITIDHSLRD